MVEVIINYWAVLVSGLVCMIVGSLWYSPLVFGNVWMKLSGMTEKQLEEAKKKGMGKTYVISFLSTLVMAYVLGHFVDYAEATTFMLGMQTGFWIWLGFIATVMLGMVLWDNKPFTLYLINTLHYLVCLLLIGGLLAVWA